MQEIDDNEELVGFEMRDGVMTEKVNQVMDYRCCGLELEKMNVFTFFKDTYERRRESKDNLFIY